MHLLAVTVTADLVCPFSYLGCSRLFEALTDSGLALADVAWTFEPALSTRGPDAGGSLARFGDPAALGRRVQRLMGATGPAVRADVSGERAHVLLSRWPDPALLQLIFAAHFEEGRDISSMGVLCEVAARRGHAAASVLAVLEDPRLVADIRVRATRLDGLQAPRIRVSGSQPLVGVHSVAAYRQAIARARA